VFGCICYDAEQQHVYASCMTLHMYKHTYDSIQMNAYASDSMFIQHCVLGSPVVILGFSWNNAERWNLFFSFSFHCVKFVCLLHLTCVVSPDRAQGGSGMQPQSLFDHCFQHFQLAQICTQTTRWEGTCMQRTTARWTTPLDTTPGMYHSAIHSVDE